MFLWKFWRIFGWFWFWISTGEKMKKKEKDSWIAFSKILPWKLKLRFLSIYFFEVMILGRCSGSCVYNFSILVVVFFFFFFFELFRCRESEALRGTFFFSPFFFNLFLEVRSIGSWFWFWISVASEKKKEESWIYLSCICFIFEVTNIGRWAERKSKKEDWPESFLHFLYFLKLWFLVS